MSTTYSPAEACYTDEGDFREELARVFEVCHGCRLCFNLCPSFKTLFSAIDDTDGKVHSLTKAAQDRVVDECFQCKLCALKCPYLPPHQFELDYPKLMLRARVVRHVGGDVGVRERIAEQMLSRTDMVGRVSVAFGGLVNRALTKPGTPLRRAMGAALGIAPKRMLPPYAKQRFSTWFRKEHTPSPSPGREDAEAVIFPTCFVEYMEPGIGKAVVRVEEHNGVKCSLPDGVGCCGAPWLHAGNLDQFRRAALANVEALAGAAGSGSKIIVAQATCAYVMRKDYPAVLVGSAVTARAASELHVGSDAIDDGANGDSSASGEGSGGERTGSGDAGEGGRSGGMGDAGAGCRSIGERTGPSVKRGSLADDVIAVAAAIREPAEHLMELERLSGKPLRRDFSGFGGPARLAAEVAYHVSCHSQAQAVGLKDRDLLKLAGWTVRLVNRCAGIDGTWGYRSANEELARLIAGPLVAELSKAGVAVGHGDIGAVACGSCHLANVAILEETGVRPVHPIELVERAYGLGQG